MNRRITNSNKEESSWSALPEEITEQQGNKIYKRIFGFLHSDNRDALAKSAPSKLKLPLGKLAPSTGSMGVRGL